MTTTQTAHILVLVSSPLDASINLGDDLARLREAVASLPYAAQFDVHVAEAQQIGDLLARADRPPYDVVHYLGHGDLLQDGVGVLWFEDEAGQARAMRDVNLLATLQPTGKPEFKLALISACHSASVLPAMLALGIRHVIAVEADQSVYELAAVAFYRRFYLALLTGASVSEAFTAGCRAVFNEPKLGAAAAAEAAKFKLLPEGGSHEERLFAGLPSGQMTFNDLPALTDYPFHQQPREYVGRNGDMHKLIAQLNAHRAASVIGPSGVGKTELARQVARWLVARRRFRPERVGFASLANVRTADEARAQIARALGLKPDDIRDDGALARLCPHDFLLIVDEAEGVIHDDGARFRNTLNALIGAPARPHVIVTSQTDPNTPHAPPLPVQRLSDDAAFRLFALNAGLSVEQLRRISPDDLLKVLAFVDRLPRAIELVARVWWRERGGDPHNLDLGPLLAELRAKRDQVMHDPDYPEEVKSVTVGIQLAYERLRVRSAGAARLYACLGLFPGGVSKAGLSAIFGAQAADQARFIQAQSLVEMPFSHLPAPLNDLLYLPAPFAAFARRQLPGGEEAARREIGAAVLRWYENAKGGAPASGWISVLDAHLHGGGEAIGAFIARYDAERPSIEAWLDWGYAHEQCGDGLSRSARLTARLENLYIVTNVLHLPETRRRLESALASARRCGDRLGEANTLQARGDLKRREDDLQGARQDYDAALPIYRAIGARLGEANTLKARGDLKLREDDLQGARQDYDAALPIYRAIGDRLGEANTLKARGDLKRREDDLQGARRDYDAALPIYCAIGDRLGEANTLKARGDLKLREADLQGARQDYDAALPIYRAIGARLGEANTLKARGDLKLREADLQGARQDYDAALPIYRAIGDRLGEANTLQARGDLKRREDDLQGARQDYDAALPIYRAIGARLGEANTLQARGDLKLREDDLQGARQDYDAALPIYRAIGDRLGEANTLQARGDLKRREDDLQGARQDYDAALPIYCAIGDRLGEANTLQARGDLKRREADLQGARQDYDAALPIYRAIGDRLGEANTLQARGDLKRREADLQGARQDYDAALPIYRAIGDRLGEANTLQARGDLKRREADLQGARQDYDAALPIYRAIGDRLGEANTLKALGSLERALGNHRASLDALQQALAIHSAIQDLLGAGGDFLEIGRTMLAAKQAAQAVFFAERALEIYRDIGDRFGQCLALDDQGDALYELRLAEPAFAAWWQALALARQVNPPLAQRLTDVFDQIRRALGDAKFDELVARLNQDAEGIRLAGVQVAQAQQARAAALAAADELFEAKRYDEARAAFQRIVDALPDDADALNGLGNALESLGRYAEALEAYSRAVMAQPGVAMLRRNRANLLLRLGRYDEAAQDVAEAVRLEPDHPFTRARQGGLALARGQFAEAQAHFAAAIAARPDDSAGWQALRALASLGLGEVAAAQQAIAALAPRLDDDDRAEALLWLERLVAARPALAAAALVIREALSAGKE